MKYLLINLTVQEGEREHKHRCLETTCSDSIHFPVEQFVSNFWGKGKRDGDVWEFPDGFTAKLDNVVELSKEEYTFLSQLFIGRRPKYMISNDVKRIKAAAKLLCDNRLSIKEQLYIIDNYEGDSSNLLDYVDDAIEVWAPLGYQLTVDDFLHLVDD